MKKKKVSKNIDKKKDVGGRPSKLDYSTVQILVDIFRIAGSIDDATSQAEICRAIYFKWIKDEVKYLDINGKEKDFASEMRKARNFPKIAAKRTVVNAAIKGDTKASLEYLKRTDPEWKDKAELSGDPENPIERTVFIMPDNGRGKK